MATESGSAREEWTVRKEVWKAIFSEGASSGTGFLAKMSGMSGLWEVGATVVAVAGVAVAAGLTGLLWNRVKRLTKESPEQAVPVESVESIFQVLSDEQNLVANDKLYDALAELENVYGTAEVDAKLNEAVAEWSRNRPEGAGNPPGRADMVKVLRTMVQGSHEAKYRELFAQYCRKLVSIEQTNVNYRPLIEDVFVQLRAERSPDSRNRRGGVLEGDHLDDDRNGLEFLDFRGKNPVEIENMLRSAGNLVILGEPGSGKSTLLRYLAANCAESHSESPIVPLLLPLREVAAGEGGDSLFAEKAASFSRNMLELHIPKEFFNRSLQEGRCLFFLDALDEVPESDRGAVVGKIGDLVEEYSTNRFVVTSRRAGYDDRPLPQTEGFFNRYLVQPMENEDITSFVNRRFDKYPEEAAQVMSILDGNPGIKALAANPLHLAIFNMVHRELDDSPEELKRTDYFRTATEILTSGRDEEGQSIGSYDFRNSMLAAVAYDMHQSGAETLGRITLERFLTRFLLEGQGLVRNQGEARQQAADFIKLAERRMGLLVEQSNSGEKKFGFLHSAFREYLTAKYINDRHFVSEPDDYWDEMKEHLEDAHWREVILFLVGMLDTDYCTNIIERILAVGDASTQQPELSNLPTHLQLAAEALANQAPMSPELQQEVVGRLGKIATDNTSGHMFISIDFRTSGYLSVTREAIASLSGIRHLPELINPTLTTIATARAIGERYRVSAAGELGRLGETVTAISLLTAIATDPEVSAEDRVSAARELGRLGETVTAISLLTAIATDPEVSAEDRVSAARELGRLGETVTAISLLTAIATDPSIEGRIRVSAAGELGRLGETVTAISLLTAIATDPSIEGWIRLSAAGELGRLGETVTAISFLTAIATDPEVKAEDRVFAAGELVRLGEPDTAISLLPAIATDPSIEGWIRMSATRELGRLGEREEAIVALSAFATDPSVSDEARRLSADSLGRLGREGIRALTSIATDPKVDAEHRNPAAEKLAGLGEDGIAELIAVANGPEITGFDRTEIVNALSRVVRRPGQSGNGEAAKAALAQLAQSPRVPVELRRLSIFRLGEVGEVQTAIAALTDLLNAPDAPAADTWIATLSAIATNPAVDARIRVVAAVGLGRLGETDTAISALIAIATGPAVFSGDRKYALEWLRDLGGKDTAIATLSAIATDPAVFAQSRSFAAEGLMHLGETDSAMATLTAIATDPVGSAGFGSFALTSLRRLGGSVAIATLTAVATDPAVDARIRVSAAEELVGLGETDAAISALIAIATDPAVDARHRRSAAERLVGLGETDTSISTLSAIATDPAVDAEGRVSAAERLVGLGETDTAISALIAIATDPAVDARHRRSAAGELGRLGEDGIAELTAIAKGPEIAEVGRSHVVDALDRVVRQPEQSGNSEAAKAALAQLAQDATVAADVRSRAAWRLGRLGEVQAAIAALTHLVNDPAAPAMEKVRAAAAIQEFGGSPEEPIAAMRAGIADSEIAIGDHVAMAWRLSGLGERDEGIAILAEIANDETVDDINRVGAAWYLGELDASESARAALNVLTAVAECETAEPWRRFQAGKVLADLGVKETAITALTAVAHNAGADAEDRIDAAKGLANLGDKATAETVLQTIADDRLLSNADRDDAREALRKLNEE